MAESKKCKTCANSIESKECKDCENPAGFKLCNQPYALCSKANCVLNRKTNTYTCKCENFNGCSMGTEECSKLAPYTDDEGKNIIFSTFSPEFAKQGFTLNTGPAKRWANCLNQKCTINPKNSKESICECEVATGPEVTYNDKSLENVSGASFDSFLQTAQFWESCLGVNILKLNQEAYKINEIKKIKKIKEKKESKPKK